MTKVNKTDFVRQHPNLSAKEIVTALKKKRVKMSVNHVYTIRGQLRQTAAKKNHRRASHARSLRAELETTCKRFVDEVIATVRKASIADLLG